MFDFDNTDNIPPFAEAVRDAIDNGDIVGLRQALDKGGGINIRFGKYRATPIHFASKKHNLEIVEELFKRGADIDAKDGIDDRPLHEAVRFGKQSILSFLLEKKADPNVRNIYGDCPLVYCFDTTKYRINGWTKKAKVLLKHGAKKNMKNHHGKTAVDHLDSFLQRIRNGTSIENEIRNAEELAEAYHLYDVLTEVRGKGEERLIDVLQSLQKSQDEYPEQTLTCHGQSFKEMCESTLSLLRTRDWTVAWERLDGQPQSKRQRTDEGVGQQQSTAGNANKVGNFSIKISSTPTTPGSTRVHTISSLTPYQNRWRIRARVTQKGSVRTWSNSRGEGKLFSVNFTDESGEIRATGFNEAVDKYYDMLEMNKVYYVSRGTLKTANKQYSNVQNDYEMTFNQDTAIEPCTEEVDLPGINFQFVALNELESKAANSLVDVIGVVKSCNELGTVTGKQSQKMITKRDITVVDQSGMSVSMTLWGNDAVTFSGDGNPVMAVKGARLSDYGGRSLSVLASSQVLMNPTDLKIAFQLKSWFDTEGQGMEFQSFRGGGSEGNDLPVEILQMDQQSIQLYRMCLEEKEEEDYRLRVIVIGQTEVGKTTLTRNLLRLPQIIPHTESTDGVDIHNSFVNLADKDWVTDADMQHAGKCLDARLIQSLQSTASENTGADPNTEVDKSAQTASTYDDVSFSSGEFDNDQQNAGHARQIQSLQSTVSKNTGADSDDLQNVGPSTPANSNEQVSKTLRNLIKVPLADRDYTKLGELCVWDFAGQFVYYTTHHTFLTHRAVYLLVTRLDQNINDTVNNDQCFLDASGCKEMKIKDFVSYWMNSVHIYSGVDEHLPPVILVGTHLDKVEGDREKKKTSHFVDIRKYLLDMKSPTLCHLIDTDYTVSNPPDELEIGNLRQKIVDIASKQTYWGEKIPAKWITLEKGLMEKKINGVNIMSYDNVVELDKSTGVPIDDQDKLDLFLRFQHAKGNMIYFSEGCLRDHIVLNPQWLIDAFKCIITARQFCIKNALVQYWEALDKTGKLYLGMVDEIFRREDKFCRHKGHILGLMERLHIISHHVVDKDDDKSNTPEEFYFVPSLLKDKVTECEIENYVKGTKRTPYLCYIFENNFLPTAVFHRLIAACLSEYPVAKQGTKFLIFCGCGIFDLNGGLTRLVVAFYDSVIQIGLFRFNKEKCAPETSTCVSVRQFVTETLERVLGRYHMELPFTLNLKCEKSPLLSHEGLLSVDPGKPGDKDVVCHAHEKGSHIINRHSHLQLWFPDQVSVTDTNQGDPIRLTEQDLQRLASCFGSGWEMFVGQLGVGNEKVDQKKIENSTHVPSQVYNCLLVWFRKCPKRPTITVFDQTLRNSLDLCSVNMDKYETLKRDIENR